jgi:hypothetical protein
MVDATVQVKANSETGNELSPDAPLALHGLPIVRTATVGTGRLGRPSEVVRE